MTEVGIQAHLKKGSLYTDVSRGYIISTVLVIRLHCNAMKDTVCRICIYMHRYIFPGKEVLASTKFSKEVTRIECMCSNWLTLTDVHMFVLTHQNGMLGMRRTPFTALPRLTSLRMILVISKLFFLCSLLPQNKVWKIKSQTQSFCGTYTSKWSTTSIKASLYSQNLINFHEFGKEFYYVKLYISLGIMFSKKIQIKIY